MSGIVDDHYIILISPTIYLIAIDHASAINLITVIKWLATQIVFALARTVLEIVYNRLFLQKLESMFILHWLDKKCFLS
jgi:hypothetical protein